MVMSHRLKPGRKNCSDTATSSKHGCCGSCDSRKLSSEAGQRLSCRKPEYLDRVFEVEWEKGCLDSLVSGGQQEGQAATHSKRLRSQLWGRAA